MTSSMTGNTSLLGRFGGGTHLGWIADMSFGRPVAVLALHVEQGGSQLHAEETLLLQTHDVALQTFQVKMLVDVLQGRVCAAVPAIVPN